MAGAIVFTPLSRGRLRPLATGCVQNYFSRVHNWSIFSHLFSLNPEPRTLPLLFSDAGGGGWNFLLESTEAVPDAVAMGIHLCQNGGRMFLV